MVKRLPRDFEYETSLVNEVHSYTTTPTSGNYFRISRKKKTTHKYRMQLCSFIVKSLTEVHYFYLKRYCPSYKIYFGQRFHSPMKYKRFHLIFKLKTSIFLKHQRSVCLLFHSLNRFTCHRDLLYFLLWAIFDVLRR